MTYIASKKMQSKDSQIGYGIDATQIWENNEARIRRPELDTEEISMFMLNQEGPLSSS